MDKAEILISWQKRRKTNRRVFLNSVGVSVGLYRSRVLCLAQNVSVPLEMLSPVPLKRNKQRRRTVTSWQEGHPGVVRIYWAIFFFSGVWQWNKILTKVLVRRYQAFPAGKTGSSLLEWNTASQDGVVVLKSSCLGGFFSPLMPVLKEGKQFSKYTASPGCLFPVRCGISCSGR